MNIEIKQDGTAIICSKLPDGSVSAKTVDLSALCKALASDTVEVNMRVPEYCRGIIDKGRNRSYLFVYPKRRVDVPLIWSVHDSDKYGECLEYKPDMNDQRFVNYNRNNLRLFNIPFPPLALIVTGCISDSEYGQKTFNFNQQFAFALSSTSVPLDKASYYRYPFTNVFHAASNCCMGHDVLHSVPEASVNYYPQMLYASVGNHDLDVNDGSYWNVVEGGALGVIKSQYQLISQLGLHPEIKEFPCQYLKFIGTDIYNLFENLVANDR